MSSLVCWSLLSYRKYSYFIPYFSSFVVYIFFLWPTPYPTLNCNLVYCLSPFHSLFFSGTPGATASPLVVTVPLTPLFLIPWFDILLYLRLCVMVSINQCLSRQYLLKGYHPRLKSSFYPWDRLSPAGLQPGILKPQGIWLLQFLSLFLLLSLLFITLYWMQYDRCAIFTKSICIYIRAWNQCFNVVVVSRE